MIGTPHTPKSLTFRVTTTNSCSIAVAAISPSATAITLPPRRAPILSRPPSVRDRPRNREQVSTKPIRDTSRKPGFQLHTSPTHRQIPNTQSNLPDRDDATKRPSWSARFNQPITLGSGCGRTNSDTTLGSIKYPFTGQSASGTPARAPIPIRNRAMETPVKTDQAELSAPYQRYRRHDHYPLNASRLTTSPQRSQIRPVPFGPIAVIPTLAC